MEYFKAWVMIICQCFNSIPCTVMNALYKNALKDVRLYPFGGFNKYQLSIYLELSTVWKLFIYIPSCCLYKPCNSCVY